jgi:hypothetical protein
MSEEVRVIKLVSGEEIICTAVNDTDGKGVTISDGILVIPQQGPVDQTTGKSQIVFAFIPWGTLVEKDIYISNQKVIYNEAPEAQLLAHYGKITGKAKIEVPPKSLVIAR